MRTALRPELDVADLYVQVPRDGRLAGVGITDHAVYRWLERVEGWDRSPYQSERHAAAAKILAGIPGAEMYPTRTPHPDQEVWYLTDWGAELRVARNLGAFPLYPTDVFDFIVITALRGTP